MMKLLLKEYDAPICSEESSETELLRQYVTELSSFDRSLHNEDGNRRAAALIVDYLKEACDYVTLDGEYNNIIAGWGELECTDSASGKHGVQPPQNKVVIGGHYDSPPGSPGADDNGSAVATLIALAKRLKDYRPKDVVLVAFNGEEEGLLGSYEFVRRWNPSLGIILEMVGYFTNEPDTQVMPSPLPNFSIGDFLGIVGNRYSQGIGKKLIKTAKSINLSLPLKSIQIPFGLEDRIPGLQQTRRSDHYPFWKSKLPAVMLTDTAEFRNKNYHQPTDTPDTLNYPAMCQVVGLLDAFVREQFDELE